MIATRAVKNSRYFRVNDTEAETAWVTVSRERAHSTGVLSTSSTSSPKPGLWRANSAISASIVCELLGEIIAAGAWHP